MNNRLENSGHPPEMQRVVNWNASDSASRYWEGWWGPARKTGDGKPQRSGAFIAIVFIVIPVAVVIGLGFLLPKAIALQAVAVAFFGVSAALLAVVASWWVRPWLEGRKRG